MSLGKPQMIAHAQQGLPYTVFECKWVPRSARLLCLGTFPRGTGVLQLYQLQGGRLRLLRQIEKSRPIKCGTFGASSLQQRYLATGDFGGNLNIWDCEGVGPKTKRHSCCQYGTSTRREQERLLDSSIWQCL